MKHAMLYVASTILFSCLAAAQSTLPPVVKITPLGSHAGEFCRNDRALLFEDPTGVRILYDPGRTIDGGTDARLGDVHVVLLSHAHTDHIGDVKPNPAAPGTCGNPGTVPATPNSNLGDIVAAKNSAFFGGGELQDLVGRKIQDSLGASSATAACPGNGLTNEVVVPSTAPCTASLRPGGSRTARMNGASAGVKIATVQAFHSNGLNAAFVDDPGVAPGTSAYGGSENGFILIFTNGLSVYLTGDTGMFGDMRTIIRRYYQPTLMVPNISDTATLGPDEGAFVATKLVRPVTVIPSHINEAATTNGQPTGARLLRFLGQMNGSGINVVLPLSGVTRQFDGAGNCLNC
ncbi:MAG TPA: MBL fold metallo-hydrolase [Bryobacteraceae bacterium]|nr:MBL fold metallo-hydrolase [Bryobacteraceae bacterium]